MAKKNKKPDDLDTETTFADMNIEGFRWYDPNKKKQKGTVHRPKISRKEYWQMVKGAFSAYLPIFLIITIVFAIMGCIAWIWVS